MVREMEKEDMKSYREIRINEIKREKMYLG